RVAVMYAGELVELAPADELFEHPRHPYTQGLIRSMPKPRRVERLHVIPGRPPDLTVRPAGCPFADRCPQVIAPCRTEHPAPGPGRVRVARPRVPLVDPRGVGAVPAVAAEPLVEIEHLTKVFPIKTSNGFGSTKGHLSAVDDVSLTIGRGETLGLVGESGSG